jgi:hypothetical protein
MKRDVYNAMRYLIRSNGFTYTFRLADSDQRKIMEHLRRIENQRDALAGRALDKRHGCSRRFYIATNAPYHLWVRLLRNRQKKNK